MATTSYKCPSCGAGIEFNPESQRFDCSYCLSKFTQEELDQFYLEQAQRESQKTSNKVEREEQHQDETQVAKEQEQMAEYICDSCGAHVVTSETTAATFCYYCHNPVVLNDRLSGEFKPDLVLPFHLSKENAKQTFLNWTKGYRYVPKDFTSDDHLEKITGLYLPYWLNDATVNVDFAGSSRTQRTWTSGDYLYTETSVYSHERRGEVVFDDLPAIAFSKFDPDLLRAVTPFDMTEAKNFSPSYLSGFFAEQFDLDKDAVAPVLQEAARGYSNTLLYQGLQGHGAVQEQHKNLSPQLGDWELVLLPTWVLTYNYGGKTYVYAVNGQNGRSYGELPMNEGKLRKDSLITAAIVLIIATLLVFWFWR